MANRYFVGTMHECLEVERLIEKNKIKETVFQVVIRQSKYVARFTWFLLKNDMSFKRVPLGSGITNFFIDRTMPFFMQKK